MSLGFPTDNEASALANESGNASPPSPLIASAITTTTLALLKSLLDLSPDAMVVINQAGTIVQLNSQAGALFGYTPDQLVGRPLEALLPERLRTSHLAHRGQYLEAPHSRPMGVGLDLVGRRQDGSEFPVDISLRPYLIKRQLHVMAAIRDVSVQRQWERERKDLIERLRLQTDLINLAHDAILVRDPADRILVWNTGAEELYGWRASEAIGQVTHTLFKTRFPTSRVAVQAQLDREGAWEGELVHTRPDGRVVIVDSRWVLVRDEAGLPSAVLEINRDITERRRLEEAEAATQANTLVQLTFLQQLLDALPNGVYVVHGRDARLVLANRAATSAWGAVWRREQPMQEFLKQHRILLTDAQGQPIAIEQWATIRALRHGDTTLQLQETIHRSQGDALPILVNAVPLTFSYWQSLGIVSEHDDESATGEFSHADTWASGEPLALVIQQNVRILKEAEYMKDEFIGLAAHELRTPVAVLKGAIGTLLLQTRQGHGSSLADWQLEMLQDIDLASDRLTSLTDDLLDVTRLQAGQLLLHLAPTDLMALIRRVVGRILPAAPGHEAIIHPMLRGKREKKAADDTNTSAEVIVTIDVRRIEQVLTNLLINAIKYSPAGGSIQISLALLDVDGTYTQALSEARLIDRNRSNHKFVEIQVRDHGIGIPASQQNLIFGRFMRADNARQAGISGTGLGLYISRGLVEQHGGQIWFESQEGKGTTFHMTLPLQPIQDTSTAAQT